jgi:putative transcriptional regulator
MKTITSSTKRPTTKRGSAVGDKLIAAMEEAIKVIDEGGLKSLKTTVLTVPEDVVTPQDVAAIRTTLGLSQPLFAEFIGVSVAAVRAWERGAKSPTPMAKRFLTAIRSDPGYWKERLGHVTEQRTV